MYSKKLHSNHRRMDIMEKMTRASVKFLKAESAKVFVVISSIKDHS
jgi:phenylpyruvate tautomerase PptA (4-oxalocrotonate tautomerase family)